LSLKFINLYYTYNISDVEDSWKMRNDIMIEFSKHTSKYKFILEDEDKQDYPIEEYYDNDNIYIELYGEEIETIDTKEISNVNKDTEILLNDVDRYFYKKYGNYKYNIINVYDDEENHKCCIKLRITDHTENIHNIDRFESCDFHISVVISNFDVTEKRFHSNIFERSSNEMELKYDSDTSFDEIIDEINGTIEEFADILLEK
jgi:hypothetical protein